MTTPKPKPNIENKAKSHFSVHAIDKYTCINLKEGLMYGSVQDTKNQLLQLPVDDDGYVIDLRELENIDSTGFGVLISFAKAVGIDSGKIVVVITDAFIRELFMISKFHLIFPIVDTIEDALKILNDGYQTALTIDEY